jgi:hypothetical protein
MVKVTLPVPKQVVFKRIKEYIDVENEGRLMNCPTIRGWTRGDISRLVNTFSIVRENMRRETTSSDDKDINERGFIPVVYSHELANSGEAVGRLHISVEGRKDKPYTFTDMWREVRAIVAKKYYVDLDLVNCHPVLLKGLCLKYDIDHPAVEEYISNRETYLKEITSHSGVSREDAKLLYIRLMYGGTIRGWRNDLAITLKVDPETHSSFEHPRLLQREIKQISRQIFSIDEFKYICDHWNKYKQDHTNEMGSKLSMILQTYERICIEHLIDIVENSSGNYKIGGIIYDGLHIEINQEKPLNQSRIDVWAKKLSKKMGPTFDLKITIKDFEWQESFLGEPEVIFNNVDLKMYDPEIFDQLTTYDDFKSKWEQIACKIVEGAIYVVINYRGKVQLLTEGEMCKQYKHHRCIVATEKGDKSKQICFIERWIHDHNIRKYQRLELAPPPAVVDKYTYNTWDNFEGERCCHLTNRPIDVNSKECQLFIKFFQELLVKEEYAEYLLDWMARIIQKPNDKTRVAIILYSSPNGTGKSSVSQLLRALVGDDKHYSTAQPEHFIYGKFNSGLHNKYVVSIDEAQAKTSFANDDVLKEMITQKKITIKKEGLIPFETKCVMNVIIETNKGNSVNIGPESRRYVPFDCSTHRKGDTAFWDEFYRLLEDKHTIAELYTFFKTRKITRNIETDMPKTEIREVIQDSNRHIQEKWLQEYIERLIVNHELELLKNSYCDSKVSVPHSVLIDEYRTYFKRCIPDAKIPTDTSFGQKMGELSTGPNRWRGIEKSRNHKTRGGVYYEFDIDELIKDQARWRL